MIYLDNAATTKVSLEVLEAMLPYMTEDYGNPGSIHAAGLSAAKAVVRAREQCAAAINASPEQIIFTSGGSEANNLAIIGIAEYLKKIGKTHIVTTMVEHPSVLNATKYLFGHGFEVTYCPVDPLGRLRFGELESLIRPNTGLISVMAVNNEIGNYYDFDAIGALCRDRDILFHSDCVQAFGTRHINVDQINIDFLSVSGHKFHAPKGCGFLFARHKTILQPLIHGGEQEFGLRAGTTNVPSIVGLGVAAERAAGSIGRSITAGNLLQRALLTEIGELTGVTINGNPKTCGKILNLRFDGVDSETLLLLLSSRGVMVSAGSACSAHSSTPSHVLKAIGLTDDQARNSIRVSFSTDTTVEEVKEAGHIIAESVKVLRGE